MWKKFLLWLGKAIVQAAAAEAAKKLPGAGSATDLHPQQIAEVLRPPQDGGHA